MFVKLPVSLRCIPYTIAIAILALLLSAPVAAQTSVSNTATIAAPTGITDPVAGNNSATDTDTILRQGDLGVTKTDSPDPVAVGALLTYTITLSNGGPSALRVADSVTLLESLPAGLAACSYTPSAGAFDPGSIAPGAAGSGQWTGLALASGGSATLTIACTVSPGSFQSGDVITNTVTVQPPAGFTDSNAANDSATAQTTVQAPQLSMAKAASVASFVVGVPASYTLSVQNTGAAATTAATTVSDPVPAGLTLGTLPAGCVSATQTVTCTVAAGLAAGASASFVIPVTAQAAAVGTSLTNTATASGGGDPGCPAAARCSSSVTTPVLPTIDAVDDSYTVPASGGTTASVVLNDTTNGQPAVIGTNVSLLAGAVTTPPVAGTVEMNADGTITVAAGTTAGTYTVPYQICTLPATTPATCDSANATVVVSAAPALVLEKTASPTSVGAAGEVVTYTFAVRNTGNVDLTNVVVADPMLPGLSCAAIATLAPSATATVLSCTGNTYTVTQNDINTRGGGDGSIDNTATANSDQATPATASAQVRLPDLAPALAFDKSTGTAGYTAVGDAIAYSYAVTNSGNQSLAGPVVVNDDKVAVSCPAVDTVGNLDGLLDPGEAVVCTATYLVVAADILAGSVTNVASATVDGTGSPTDTVTVGMTAAPAMTLQKTAGTLPAVPVVGTVLTYGFTVTNTGNVALSGVAISDSLPGLSAISYTWPGTAGVLGVGQAATATATYTLTAADFAAGQVVNSATAVGIPTGGTPLTTPPSSTTTPLVPTIDAVDDSYTVPASGGTTASVVLNDTTNGQSAVIGTNVSLTPGPVAVPPTAGSVVMDTDGTITVAAGTTAGTYTVPYQICTLPATTPATCANANAIVVVSAAPALTLAKTATPNVVSAAGDVVVYGFTVTNTGNAALSGVAISDPLPGLSALSYTWPGAAGVLGVGQVATATATYTVTQADIDTRGGGDGFIDNTATASSDQAPPMTASAQVRLPDPAPALTILKSAAPPSGNTLGSTIAYSFLVTNTGNVSLTGIVVNDSRLPASPVCPVTTLAAGANTTCTGTYTITQADVDAGVVDNSATASGTPPTGPAITSDPSTTTTLLASAPSLTVAKTAGTPSGNVAGSTIGYSFLVTNTGNVTLTAIAIVDSQLDALASCPVASLLPGTDTTCTGTHTITQAEVDAGVVNNSATANGLPPGATTPVVSGPSTTSTPLASVPSLTVAKTAGTPSGNTAGSTVAYSFLVTNTGNVTLSAIAIVDSQLDAAASCPVTSLLPGTDTTCTGTHTITQAEVDAGVVNNSATANGLPPGATTPVGSGPSTTTTPLASAPSLTVAKTAGAPSGNTAGSTIGYSFLVTNTGNVTLTAIAIVDSQLDALASCPVASLLPGTDTTCTGTHTITQAEVDAGVVNNSATANGLAPGATTPVVSGPSTTSTPLASTPALTVVKTAGTPSGATAGSTVGYSFLVTNTGNVTLSAIAITDSQLDGAASCPVTSLLPGTDTTCTGTHTITQAEVDAGVVNNSATASGTPPTGPAITSDPSTTSTPLASTPRLTVVKTAGTPSGNTAGSTIAYSFLVTNTGNVTLSGIVVNDNRLPASPTCLGTTLAPGVDTTCTGIYTITQADVDAGVVNNSATASGTPPTGPVITSDPSTTSTPLASTPALTVAKTAGTPSGNTAGSIIAYSFLVTNTGNVTLTAIAITDSQLDAAAACPVTSLLPSTDTTCTGTHTITQAEIDAGVVNNSATASGTPPTGPVITSDPSTTTTPLASTPALTVVKTAGAPSGNTAGSTIAYSFLVTNTGNVTLTAIAIVDSQLDAAASCPVTSLLPGTDTTCTGTHTITQAEIDAGVVNNSAIATGVPPGATTPVISGPSTTTTPLVSTPALTVAKTAGTPSGSTAGSTIGYSFLVTNTGNVTLSAIAITDSQLDAAASCPVASLLPGATATCTGTHTITQVEVDAGVVNNSATASGTPPTGPVITSDPSTTTTPLASAPSLTVLKTAGAPSGNTAGSTIGYSFLVTNTGNVTLTAIAITDSQLDAAASCPVTSLLPGTDTTCTGTHTITQAEVDAGVVNNSATASGTPPTGPATTSAPSTTSTPLASAPSLALLKTAGMPSGNTAGATIGYTFAVTNTGNVTLTGLAIDDSQLDAAAACTATTLAPGASTTCAGTHTVTQAEVDAGRVDNVAVAEAVTAGSGTPVASGPSSTSTPLVAVRVAKSADPASGTTVVPGQLLTYTLAVTVANTATTAPVVLADTLSPGLTVTGGLPSGCIASGNGLTCTLPAGSAPGDYAFTYTATVDADATGNVSNNVVASGTDNPACQACTTLHPVAATVVTVSKLSDPVDGATVQPGATINYTLVATVAVSATTGPVVLTDSLAGDHTVAGALPAGCVASGTGLVCTLPAGTLPGTYEFRYATTVGAYATGQVGNAVVPSGVDDPACGSCVTRHPVAAPVVDVAKTSIPASGTRVVPGETIAYTVAVTVADAPTSAAVTLVDTLAGGQTLGAVPAGCTVSGNGLACTLPARTAPGTYRFEYSTTVDTDATGTVGNTVVPTGDDAPDCAAGCSTGHPVVADFELRLLKSVAVREVGIGDLVRYTLTVENVGDTHFVGGAIVDTPPAGFTYVEGSLSARDGDNAATVSGQYPIRIEGVDIAAGQSASFVYLLRVGAGVRPGAHVNSAQAFTGGGDDVSNVSTATVALVSDPLLDDSLVLGSVFDDADGDGWQDSAALDEVMVRGGFAAAAYIAGSTTLDRGDGPQPLADASSPLLHGVAIGAIGARQSLADPVEARQVVVRQHLSSLDFTDDFVLTSAQGVSVRMDAAGNTRVERSGEAASGRNGAQPMVERRVAQGEGGYVVDYVIRNAGIDERGIPGVRIASVEGLLVETDQFGRFHLAGIDGGSLARGRNFILKVDPATLPPGTGFTTANPLVRRITPGVPVRFDFGVTPPAQVLPGPSRQVELELGAVLFAPGSAELRDRFLPAIAKMADSIRQYRGGEVVIAADGESQALAFDRAQAVRTALLARIPAEEAAALTVSVRADAADADSLLAGLGGGGPVLGTVLFDTDRAELKPGHEALLERIAAYLEEQGGGAVTIVGHADPRGSYAYNDALGLRRARTVFDALAARLSPEVRARLRVETVKDPAAPAGSGK